MSSPTFMPLAWASNASWLTLSGASADSTVRSSPLCRMIIPNREPPTGLPAVTEFSFMPRP
jgi:hypothetical protein